MIAHDHVESCPPVPDDDRRASTTLEVGEFARTIRRLADLRELVCINAGAVTAERSALDHFADQCVADIERDDPGPVDTGIWIHRAPRLPDRSDVHVVSRIGLCGNPWGPGSPAWRGR